MSRMVVVTPEELDTLVRTAVREELAKAREAEPHVLNAQEAADLLRWHYRTVLTRAREGALPAHWVGHEPRFLRSELLDWIRDHGKASG